MDKQLEDIKNLPIQEVAEQLGFYLDKKESSKGWCVMRNGDDKILIKKSENLYFNRSNDDDKGTTIDFIQSRVNGGGGNLGDVRRWYKSHYNAEARHNPRPVPKVEVTPINREKIKSELDNMKFLQPDNELLISRGLTPKTLSDPRFAHSIKQNRAGLPVFPMYDREGLSGYETKQRPSNDPKDPKSKMTEGEGSKCLWFSKGINESSKIVLVESPIDAMAHAQMRDEPSVAYISTGGQISAKQADLLGSALKRAHERGAAVIAGFDNDDNGLKYTELTNTIAQPWQVITRETPQNKDWNDDLKKQLMDEATFQAQQTIMDEQEAEAE